MVVVVAMELVLVAFVIIVVRRALVLSIVQLEKISRVRKKKKKKTYLITYGWRYSGRCVSLLRLLYQT